MTNLIPYLLSMWRWSRCRSREGAAHTREAGEHRGRPATVYSLYACTPPDYQAMMWGGIITFAGWGLYGFMVPRLQASRQAAATTPSSRQTASRHPRHRSRSLHNAGRGFGRSPGPSADQLIPVFVRAARVTSGPEFGPVSLERAAPTSA